jgi:uncharacterized protein (TIGR01777 family)
MRIFLTGGTGLIGCRLVRRLRERNDQIVLLSRRPQAAQERFGSECQVVEGDPTQAGSWMDAVKSCDAVINLAGESVFGRRWSAAFKELLRESRLRITDNVVKSLAGSATCRTLVNASAIGYYGMLGDEPVSENAPPGSDVLARLCVDWEAEARQAEAQGVRVACVRIGVVLDKDGGALQQLLKPFKMFVGGPVGSGRQWVSWIHHADVVGILLLALDNAQATPALNGTATNPVTNKELSKALGRALHRPSILPMPGFALRVLLGESAGLITSGQRVLPSKALELKYTFQFPTIDSALAEILIQ